MHRAVGTSHDSAPHLSHGQPRHHHFDGLRATLPSLDSFLYEMLLFCYHLSKLRQLLPEAIKEQINLDKHQ
jgi:hypothetical protein